ncbi:paired mesoderm homeobox protein 2-like [Aricia agestis]|uniref:paired mesoderm homeobox protein 2-like n=1 Tax=Aricia agestis TaxID=91739 RepID=UPI001C20BD6C|nr:paired mesoderm homeobox protein 2-like [Aricia agestis]
MNVSRVQTSPNGTTSDFSIRRILSDDLRSSGDSSSAPSWVCCTRYQPPRLPRASGTGGVSRARRSGRHARVPFSGTQAAALEAAYARSPYLAPPALRALAAALQLRDDRIKIWFQNRRARERREKSFSVHQPHSIALPATVAPQRILPENWSQRLESTLAADRSCESDSESAGTSLSCSWRTVSSSEEDSVTSPSRCESPLDVEKIVD